MIDLHIHTDASSDGQHTPREIMAMAREIGLRTLAFADHNSIEHLAEGRELAEASGIEFIPCMELNTFHRGLDLHLLAYFINPENPELRIWLGEVHQKKIEQAEKRAARLNETRLFLCQCGFAQVL